jgi:alpha-galactosidase
VYGTTDFRQGALTITKAHDPQYLNFTYVDYTLSHEKPRDLNTPASFTNGPVDVLTLNLTDETHQLQLAMHYALFADSAAIVRWQTVKNVGDSQQRIERIASAVLDLPTANYQFVNLAGAWARERHMSPSATWRKVSSLLNPNAGLPVINKTHTPRFTGQRR